MIQTASSEEPAKSASESAIQIGIESRRKKKRTERLALVITVCFAVLVGMLAWYTEGKVFTAPIKTLMSFEASANASRDPTLNCQNPKNMKTPYCVERKARTNEDWMSMSMYHEGKGNSFTLHSR